MLEIKHTSCFYNAIILSEDVYKRQVSIYAFIAVNFPSNISYLFIFPSFYGNGLVSKTQPSDVYKRQP